MGKGSKNKGSFGEPPRKRLATGVDTPGDAGQGAEVRFANPADAQKALELDGSTLAGGVIGVRLDPSSTDSSKIIVSGVPRAAEWQEVKDFFAQCGTVAFANVKSSTPAVGAIRYATAEEATAAVELLDGAQMEGSTIEVKVHAGSTDKTKLQIFGLPPGTEWQELKDFFGQSGKVIFAEVVTNALDKGSGLFGEVRYDDPSHAQQAIDVLNGSKLGGAEITVTMDRTSTDGSKLVVKGIPAGIEWQELKDHFASVGQIAFANVKGVGKGKGKAKGMDAGMKVMSNGMVMVSAEMLGSMMGMNPMMMGNSGGGFGMKGGFGGGCGVKGGVGKKGGFGGGCGAKGGFGKKGGGGGLRTGEIRYQNPLHAQLAVSMLNNSAFNGGTLTVNWDMGSTDGSKLWIGGVPAGSAWQDLKDHFAQVGVVAFANVN